LVKETLTLTGNQLGSTTCFESMWEEVLVTRL